jgi:TolA-binding protein
VVRDEAAVITLNRILLKTTLFVLCLGWLVIPVRAQTATPPPDAPTPNDTSKAPDAPPAKKTDKKPSTAEDNPFPEDISKKAAAEAKADATNTSTPDAPTPTTPPTHANGAANEPKGSSSLDGLDKLGLDDPTRKVLKLESPDGSADVYDPKRASEDVRVGKFYLKTGDYKGAYDRFKDATDYDHEDVEAVFWLAEAARKMNHSQEALQNYQLYLEAAPDGPNSRTARKALNELASSSKP